MHAIVTGATGCLGRAVVSRLLSDGYHVLALARDPALVPEHNNLKVMKSDLAAAASLNGLPAKTDVVIHLAQSRRYRDFPAAANDIFDINVASTMQLADYAAKAGASSFIYTSTGTVYVPNTEPILESDPTTPASFYAASKLAAENLVRAYASEFTVFIPRLFYLYGPGQTGFLISVLADRIRKGAPVSLHGDEGIALCPTFSGDVAVVISQALEQSWQGLMNVADPHIVTLRELSDTIGTVVGRKPEFVANPDEKPIDLIPNLQQLEKNFDVSAFTELAEGLRLTFATNA